MAGRPIIAIVSLILLAAGLLFEFFVVLAGGTGLTTPENKMFFLAVSTDGIPNAPDSPYVGWSYYGLAALSSSTGPITSFLPKHPAFPFDPPGNFVLSGDQLNSIPPQFIGTHYYYYMSRFAWVFYLVALFFGVVALFTGLLAICSRIGGFLSGITASVAAFFMAIAAALMTTWTVKARNAFNSFNANSDARLGKYMYGFTWAAFACYFLAMILFCISGAASGRKDTTTYKERKGFFGRSKSTRSREGVKSEYS